METKVQKNSTLSACLFFSSTTCFLYSLFLHAAYLQWEYLCLSAGCEELSAVKKIKIDINYSARVSSPSFLYILLKWLQSNMQCKNSVCTIVTSFKASIFVILFSSPHDQFSRLLEGHSKLFSGSFCLSFSSLQRSSHTASIMLRSRLWGGRPMTQCCTEFWGSLPCRQMKLLPIKCFGIAQWITISNTTVSSHFLTTHCTPWQEMPGFQLIVVHMC